MIYHKMLFDVLDALYNFQIYKISIMKITFNLTFN